MRLRTTWTTMAVAAVVAATLAGRTYSASEADVLVEGFEGGAVPPTGWTVTDTNPSLNWDVVDAATAPSAVRSGSYAAFVNFDSANAQDEWLRSPLIALPAAPSVTLRFWALSDTLFCPFESATTSVVVTDAADQPIATLWDMCSQEDWPTFQYREVLVDLTAYQGQSVKLAWRYIGVNGESFGLDDVAVEAGLAPVIFSDGFESGDVSFWSAVAN